MRKKRKIPNWIIRSVQHGNEDDDLCAMIVGLWALGISCIACFFVCFSVGGKYLILQILGVLVVLVTLVLFSRWLTYKITLLKIRRKKILIAYKNSKTEIEISKIRVELEKLGISVSENV